MKTTFAEAIEYLNLVLHYVPHGEKPRKLFCRQCRNELENIFATSEGLYRVITDFEVELVTDHEGKIVRHKDGKEMADTFDRSLRVERITRPLTLSATASACGSSCRHDASRNRPKNLSHARVWHRLI